MQTRHARVIRCPRSWGHILPLKRLYMEFTWLPVYFQERGTSVDAGILTSVWKLWCWKIWNRNSVSSKKISGVSSNFVQDVCGQNSLKYIVWTPSRCKLCRMSLQNMINNRMCPEMYTVSLWDVWLRTPVNIRYILLTKPKKVETTDRGCELRGRFLGILFCIQHYRVFWKFVYYEFTNDS